MIPIRDTIPSRQTAWIVRLLVVANVTVFAFELLHGSTVDALMYRFGLVPAYWTVNAPGDLFQWPRLFATLFTSQFLHGSLLHVASNMLYLWIFGDNVEDRLGHIRFLALYLASGAIAGLTQFVMSPQASVPMIGASGAIAGVLGAYFLMFPYAKVVTLVPWLLVVQFVEVPAFVFLGLWFVIQWAQGMTNIGDVTAEMAGIAWWAHVGGFLGGMVLSGFITPHRRKMW